MSVSVRDREADAIATLVALVLDADDTTPEWWDTATAAAVVARQWVKRNEDHAAARARQQANRGKPTKRAPRNQLRTEGHWRSQQDAALVRARFRCEFPGCVAPAEHVHHRAGRCGNDPHHLDNLMVLCRGHHDEIHANPERSYREGWMVKRLGVGG